MTTNKAFSAPCGGTVGRIHGHRGICRGRVGSGLGPSEPWLFETASLTLFGVPAERRFNRWERSENSLCFRDVGLFAVQLGSGDADMGIS